MKKPLIIIAGPCIIESKELLRQTAEVLKNSTNGLNIDFYFKSSFKKANRSSINSFVGIGNYKSLIFLSEIRNEFDLPVLTDIHLPSDADIVAKYVDVIQIPAFLSRQTDLLLEAGNTSKIVNIKKGQFLAPEDMKKAADKVASTGNNKIWLTERGTSFGYHDLIVDFRSLLIMKQFGYPVIYDATHSLQKPSVGEQSGGNPEFIIPLAKAAIAAGVDGIFFETHPEPAKALSDSATQLELSKAGEFIKELSRIYEMV